MEHKEREEELKEENVSPSSSPPTPPSPLPISVGPGNHRYSFLPSPTPSPPFSPLPSNNTSAENLALLETSSTPATRPLAFSLDRKVPDDQVEDRTSCLKDLVHWFVLRCCCCLSWSRQIFDQRQKQD